MSVIDLSSKKEVDRESEVHEGLVQLLEDLLEKAKAGEITSLIATGHNSQEGILLSSYYNVTEALYTHIGNLETLKHKLITMFDEEMSQLLFEE